LVANRSASSQVSCAIVPEYLFLFQKYMALAGVLNVVWRLPGSSSQCRALLIMRCIGLIPVNNRCQLLAADDAG
jgi:hypothetical protein